MKRIPHFLIFLLVLLVLVLPAIAMAQTTALDQIPAPVPSVSNTTQNSELLTQYQTVPGGGLYQSILKQPGIGGQIIGVASSFVPGGAGAHTRYLALTDAKSDLGVPMTAAAGTPSGTVGVVRTAGTSLTLDGEATSSSAKTNKALFEFDLPDTYVAGTNIPVIVNTNYTGSGTVTGASCSMTVAAYTETNGVEAALTVSAAQLITGTATNYTFTVTGTNLVPGQHVAVELVLLVTSASGANTGHINSVAFNG
jgi:hypothetical protein